MRSDYLAVRIALWFRHVCDCDHKECNYFLFLAEDPVVAGQAADRCPWCTLLTAWVARGLAAWTRRFG